MREIQRAFEHIAGIPSMAVWVRPAGERSDVHLTVCAAVPGQKANVQQAAELANILAGLGASEEKVAGVARLLVPKFSKVKEREQEFAADIVSPESFPIALTEEAGLKQTCEPWLHQRGSNCDLSAGQSSCQNGARQDKIVRLPAQVLPSFLRGGNNITAVYLAVVTFDIQW